MNDRNWNEWPTCRKCGRRRQTACPVCGVAGIDFLLAEYLAPPEPLRQSRPADTPHPQLHPDGVEILLCCPQCDEAFAPRFYRLCPQCGEDSGSGIEIRRWALEPLSDRLLIAINGLIAVGVLLALYFWLLFRGVDSWSP